MKRFDEVAPAGWSGTTKALNKHKEIDNPFAIVWSMKKKGAKPHYKPMKDDSTKSKGKPEKKEKYKNEDKPKKKKKKKTFAEWFKVREGQNNL